MDAAGSRLKRGLAHAFGLRAERTAAWWLRLKGYRILARRFGAPGGELDLVAVRGNVVAFVEVKGRGSLHLAFGAITATKRRRIGRTVRTWLARNPWAGDCVLRGDAIFVAPRRFPRHLRDAFELEI